MIKKNFLWSVCLLFVLVACDKTTQQEGKQTVVQFTSVVEGDAFTAITGNSWTANAQVGVFMKQSGKTLGRGAIVGGGDNTSYITTAGDGNFLANGTTLEYPSDGSAVDFIAYYPYQPALDNYIYKVDVTEQGKPEEIDLLYADNLKDRTQTSVTGNLQFYHQLSQLVLNLNSSDNTELGNLTVSISGVKTKADFNLADGSLTIDKTSGTATVNMHRVGNTAEAILLPVSTVDGIKLTLTLNGNVKDIPLPSSITSLKKEVRHIFSVNVTNGGSQVELEEAKYARWRETPVIPESMLTKNNIHYINHYMPNDKKVRNYSLLYDSDLKMAYWVAYSLCSYYTTGTGNRTNDWGFDPEISSDLQFYFGKKNGSSNLAESSKYDRGHQLPSADRLRDDDVNITTFYSTNMTPQINSVNQQIWEHLEDKVRKWMSGVDTLFVVTGAMVDKDNIKYTNGKSGGRIAVPEYYFKALARKFSSSGMFYTIAFKIDNKAELAGDDYMNYAISVEELEKTTGFTFFPTLDAQNKKLDKSKWQ